MVNKRKNKKTPKKAGHRRRALLCITLLAALCLSTLLAGGIAFGGAPAEASSELGETDPTGPDAEAVLETSGEETECSAAAADTDETGCEEAPASDADETESGAHSPEGTEVPEPAAADGDVQESDGAEVQEPAAADSDAQEPDGAKVPEPAATESDAGKPDEACACGHTVTLRQADGGAVTFADGSALASACMPGDVVSLHLVFHTNSPVVNLNIYTASGERINAGWEDETEAFFTMPDEEVTVSPDYYGVTERFQAFEQSMLEREQSLAFVPLFLDDKVYGYYKKGQVIYYAGWNTRYRTVDDNEAWCVQPSYNGPDSGSYEKHYDVGSDNQWGPGENDMFGQDTYAHLAAAAWYSYGSPGFDKSMWPDRWYDGGVMTPSRYYVLAHILLADMYSYDAKATLFGCDVQFKEYIYTYVTGYDDSGNLTDNKEDPVSARWKILNAETAAANDGGHVYPDGFRIFILNPNNSMQDILSFEYEPTISTNLTVYKSSTDPDTTEDNSRYSLTGAVYYAYEDNACTTVAKDVDGKEAKFITTASGKSNTREMETGTYYIREVTASKGFLLDETVYPVTLTEDSTGFRVRSGEPPIKTSLLLTKISADPDRTNGNPLYSLEGAVYGVYTDSDCTRQYGSMVTDAGGSASLSDIPLGVYWVKEISPSEGFDADPTVYEAALTTAMPVEVVSAEPSQYGYLELYKLSSLPEITDANSCYSPAGAVYGIYGDSSCRSLIQSITTDDSGYAKSGKLPLGTYFVRETVRPDGYELDESSVYEVTIGSSSDSDSNVEPVNGPAGVSDLPLFDTIGILLSKIDAESGESVPQGDTDLAGAQFTIRFYAGDVSESDTAGRDPTRIWVIQTLQAENGFYLAVPDDDHWIAGDEFYRSESGSVILPLGTYTIQETGAPSGYRIEGSFADSSDTLLKAGEIYYTRLTDDGSSAGNGTWLKAGNEYTQSDTPIRGGIEIQKRDFESGRADPAGAASFEGAVFEITNESRFPVQVDGTRFKPGEIVKTLVTDADGYACTEEDTLPFGTYRITEVCAPEGCLIGSIVYNESAKAEQIFEIREQGVLIDMTALPGSITDQVKRGDFSFEKQSGETQATMGPVKFRLTSATTGESHIFWTDQNGQYSSASAWEPHTQNTNAGESFEDGLWFYGYNDAEETGRSDDIYALTEEDDRLGALPYDHYFLDELPCSANEGYTLVSTEFWIYGDNVEIGSRADVHLGTLDNYRLGFCTSASNAENSRDYMDADACAVIVDEIRYWGLNAGEAYRFVTRLFDVTAGDFILDEDGGERTVETPFTPRSKDGSAEVEYLFDASGLEGHTLVLFEDLYDTDGNLRSPEENPEDTKQTIRFPFIGTELTDEDGNHVTAAAETVTLTDTVTYEGLPTLRWITLYGTLYDRETGEPLIDADGKEVTAQKKWLNLSADGSVEITLTFSASSLAGHDVVASEEAYVNGVRTAHHFDWDDTDQTVRFEPEDIPEPEAAEPETLIPAPVPEVKEPMPEETVPAPEPEEPVVINKKSPAPEPKTVVPTRTGDIRRNAWIVVVIAAAVCLVIGLATRRRQSE